jgi:cytochrome b pre-mRNA-processing protein 3
MQALRRLFGSRPAVEKGRRLYAAAAAQARTPAFYAEAQVPDTPEGRFELYTLHVVTVLHRLKGQGSEAAEASQALFDAYVQSLDGALRELGVGDLSVGKKMRKLGEAFYGRVKNYDEAFAGLPDTAALHALIARTAFAGVEDGDADGLTAYAADAVKALAAQPLAEVLDARLRWPRFGSGGTP